MSRKRKPNPMCPHPDEALEYRSERKAQPARPEVRDPQKGYITQYARNAIPYAPSRMICRECDWDYPVPDEEAYVRAREEKWCYETGNSSVIICDMFGMPIKKGSMVVYPTLSGRSATLSYGEVVEVNPPSKTYPGPLSWYDQARRVRCNAPDRLKVQPRPYTSRWKKWQGDDAKVVTLTANAPSAVVIK